MKKIFAELFEKFVKSNKREPKGIELIQLKFKANELNRQANKLKVVDFEKTPVKVRPGQEATVTTLKPKSDDVAPGTLLADVENLKIDAEDLKNDLIKNKNDLNTQLDEIVETGGDPFRKKDNKFLGGSMHEEGQIRTGVRMFLQDEVKNGRLKLNKEDLARVMEYFPTKADDPILVFKKIYGDDAYDAAGKFPGAFEKGDDYNHYREIFKENMGEVYLKPKNADNLGDGRLVLDSADEVRTPIKDEDVPFAEGGSTSTGLNYLLGEDDTNSRVPYATGGRRGFLKILAGLGAAGAAFKTGLLSLGKGAAKPAAKVAAEAATSTAPPHFLKLVAKIKALGDDVTETAALAERQNVKKYKDFELTEDIATGKQEIIRYKQSDEATYYGQPLTEETYMAYTPGETIIGKGNKPVKTLDDYEEGTAFVRNDRGYTGEIVEESSTISDDILEEVEAGSGNVPESFYTGPNKIKRAEGGRMGYAGGKKVVEGLVSLLNKKAGKDILTTADKIKTPQKTLDREMFKKFETKYPETSAADATLNIPVQQEGKFTKAEYLIQRLENTIKESPNDKYVQDTFPGFIDELKTNPELAKNENVFKELGGDLPEGQQIVVYGDDTLDFFTQKSGPGNIDRIKKLMAKHNISREKALKIMKMEPNDQVMELKMLEVANRKLNSEGGRIGLLSGGGVLKKLIMNLAKEKGMSGSEVLKVMNYKSLPSKIKNLMTKEEFDKMKDQRLEGVEIWKDLMYSQQEMTKNVDAGLNTPAAELFKELEKTSPGYGIVPRDISDADMLQMEQLIKNIKTKDNRQLNATGGLANLLGE